jgi:hypothetical protein
MLAALGVRTEQLELAPLHVARFLGEAGASVIARSRRPYALLVRRGPDDGTLDFALARRARAVGAIIRTGSRLDPADADVVATGPSQVDGLALEATFATEGPDRVDVLLDRAFLSDGYAYLFVRNGRGTLGVTTLSAFRDLDERLHEAMARFARVAPLELREPRTARAAMSFWIPRTACPGGRPHVGEAGGFQDYLYGLGLHSAFASGTLAARALLAGADYDRLWRSALRRRMRASVVDRYLFEAMPRVGARSLGLASGIDLQQALDGVHRDRFWKRLVFPWIAARWARGGRACKHGPLPHWCRRVGSARMADAPATGGNATAAARGPA